jgi:hypothetical protein
VRAVPVSEFRAQARHDSTSTEVGEVWTVAPVTAHAARATGRICTEVVVPNFDGVVYAGVVFDRMGVEGCA